MSYQVYILKSMTVGKIYVGHTEDLGRRIQEHRSGLNQSTQYANDWVIIHIEEYSSRSLAMKREKYLKSGDGHKTLRFKGII